MSAIPDKLQPTPPLASSRLLPKDACVTAMEKNFRHVLIAIQSMWGYPELNIYFAKLTMNERGNREGFPEEVWDDIRLLWDIHQDIVPGSFTSTAPSIRCV